MPENKRVQGSPLPAGGSSAIKNDVDAALAAVMQRYGQALGLSAQWRFQGSVRDGEKFERHKQAWTSDEVAKLHALAKKGMPLRAIAKALTRSEDR